MALFPTKILLATDGSEAAKLAAQTAVELANRTDSKLHVVCVEEVPVMVGAYAAPRGEIPLRSMLGDS